MHLQVNRYVILRLQFYLHGKGTWCQKHVLVFIFMKDETNFNVFVTKIKALYGVRQGPIPHILHIT
jgi:hypothetical protein